MAMATSQNLQVVRGDTKSYLLHFTDGAGADRNISGWTIFMTVSNELTASSDTRAKIQKTVTSHTDPTHGKTTITLTSTDTNLIGDYYYDIQIKRDSTVIETILVGVISFTADVTKRTT